MTSEKKKNDICPDKSNTNKLNFPAGVTVDNKILLAKDLFT